MKCSDKFHCIFKSAVTEPKWFLHPLEVDIYIMRERETSEREKIWLFLFKNTKLHLESAIYFRNNSKRTGHTEVEFGLLRVKTTAP